MVNVVAKSAKFYWRLWAPPDEPMVRAIEEEVDTQRRYLGSLRKPAEWRSGKNRQPGPLPSLSAERAPKNRPWRPTIRCPSTR